MRCVFCGNDTKVIDKRDNEETIRRRRECISCDKRFTTYERPEINLIVIKKDGRREGFRRDKILNGVLRACEKRPISRETIEKLVDDIEKELREYGDEIESKKIGDMVMEKLKALDKIAYIRFASVYRSFDDIGSFEKELKQLRSG
ncbi:MAG: transcriptional repressor NrdR [Candidatus Aenigmarchaeota archaeon]|nr:transcriptional repressor NrdR [Candidatus Aenigmarchaeota archaeon]